MFCPCDGDVSSQFSDNKLTIEGVNYASKIQDCKIFKDFIRGFEQYEHMAKSLEKNYKCSGLCTQLPDYVFINRGVEKPV